MKKFLIPVITILVLFIGAVIYGVYYGYEKNQYANQLTSHFMDVQEDGELIAEYNGVKTRVLNNNLNRIQKVIGVSDKNRLFRAPEYDEDLAIYLNFSDGAEYIVAENDDVYDGVFIIYTYNDKTSYYSVEGYRSFDWASKAVSLEGINSANEVIE